MAQTLGDIRQLLASHGLVPKKRFGQNFLHDARKMQAILAAASIRPGDLVLEVGAGTGALSEHLLDAGADLVAVEVDRDLEPILRQRLAPWPGRARLIFADVLADKRHLATPVIEALGGRPFTLVANLPYNVASPLLVNLAMDYPSMRRAVVMVQREVADRLAAGPGGKDYGPLGILVQAACDVRRVTILPPGCFWPPPSIDSAVVELQRRDQPVTADLHQLAVLVHRLFEKRRKQIGTIMGRSRAFPPGIDATARPEQLSLDQLSRLAAWLEPEDAGEA